MADSPPRHQMVVRRLRHGEVVILDCLAAAGLAVGYLALASTQQVTGPLMPVSILVIAGMSLPVAVRRLWPVPACAVVTVMSAVAALLGVVREPLVGVALTLYAVAVTAPGARWTPSPMIGVASVTVLVGSLLAGSPPPGANDVVLYVLGAALVGMAWTLGWAVRERRVYAARSAQQFATRAVAEERLRIARELHDIVAHNLGVIAVKVGVANHVLRDLPPQASDALRVIEASSRTALAEMRHMLGVLRAEGTTEGAAELRPAPGLACVPELVERAATAGVAVELHTRDLDRLPESVDCSAYRIVQEALTNVMKHAAPTRCWLTLVAAEDELLIDVADNGAGSAAGGAERSGGHGLIGMRERVALYGGDFRAGPREEGGFAVTARLPY